MSSSRIASFAAHIALLIVLLGLIKMIFSLHRFAFMGEFLILLALLLMALISVVGIQSNFSWAWKLLKVFFALSFLDMFLVYWLSNSMPDMFLVFSAAAVAGFFISLFSISHDKIEYNEGVKKTGEVKKTFKPGKYIASKSGSKFHSPKCDWAKKVKKSNALWFDSKEEAIKAGYKADDCVN